MSDGPLTVKILEEIREELRATRVELRGDLRAFREETSTRFVESNARFEVIETTLRDLAQQMVMLSRAVKVAIESRGASETRVDEIERRVAKLESKAS